MSNLNSSRRLNITEYMANLNEIPTQGPSISDDFAFEDNLAMFTNTNFYDADDHQPVEADSKKGLAHDGATSTSTTGQHDLSLDFNIGPDDFNNFDFSTFSTPTHPAFSDNIGGLQPLQPSPTAAYPPAGAQHHPYGITPPQVGDKRGQTRQLGLEEQSRVAAEEDKRRRNTAASARFRVKKKAREQALEKREKELAQEVETLKNKITSLETENKWLRSLVTEKTGVTESKFDTKLTALLKAASKDSDSNNTKSSAKALDESTKDKEAK